MKIALTLKLHFYIFQPIQLKTQNKNILENSTQKPINRKIFRLQINK